MMTKVKIMEKLHTVYNNIMLQVLCHNSGGGSRVGTAMVVAMRPPFKRSNTSLRRSDSQRYQRRPVSMLAPPDVVPQSEQNGVAKYGSSEGPAVWAYSFEKLLDDPLGLLIFAETSGFLAPVANSANMQIVRYRRTKHWLPKWKRFRSLKVQKIKLPNFQEKYDDLSEGEIRKRLHEQGILPQKAYMEHPYFIHSTGAVFEAYVPPEGDGKISPISAQGAMQNIRFLEKKTKTMMAIRKVRQFEEDFDLPQFCKEATDTYIKMHEMMAKGDKDNIINVVTERAYPEVIHNLENKTIRWKYLKDIELPRVVQARCTEVISKENVYAQLTVRFHTQQTLAIYDRFGRLMHGSEIIAKDVLEYVVFEKHICNEYGKWRVHAKIIPDWLPPKEPTANTYVKKKPPVDPEPEPDNAVVETTPKQEVSLGKESGSPVLAT